MRASEPIELWAGAECTVNRVGDVYFDQLERTGHGRRLHDIDRLAELGVRRVRFPVLWERCAADRGSEPDFRWSDERLHRLAALGIEPIIGLVHHGSGPADTSLCDDSFVSGLAAFAQQVARRYPWVKAYTPVNEPLTTARFACLYGHWYPHERQLGLFLRALLNEVLATRASMAAIRSINPQAQLYQTEDLGQIFATPDLEEQCQYERARRWLSLDLLFGRVDAEHPLRRHLEEHGVERQLLEACQAEPCPPDLVGVNYYVTSDRFLDSRLERYPQQLWGGNGRQRYVDVEAVRGCSEGIVGHAALLSEAFERYRAPVALTEVHLACHREDQLRWLSEAWQGAHAARAAGADVRALTLWSAFGAVGWSQLVTRESGDYEPGAYDIRAPVPRATAVAHWARHVTRGAAPEALLEASGWWRQASRLAHPRHEQDGPPHARPRLLVVGAGRLARRVAELCARRFDCELAVESPREAPQQLVTTVQPLWGILLANDPDRAVPALPLDVRRWLTPNEGAPPPRLLALSSCAVFDGWAQQAYVESDRASATDERGQRWQALERELLGASPEVLIVRCGFVMDPELPRDLLTSVLEALRVDCAPRLPPGRLISPSYLPQLVDTALDLLVDGEHGVWHLGPRTPSRMLTLVWRLAERLRLRQRAQAAAPGPEGARGPMRALASERGWPLPDLEQAIEAYASHLESLGSWQRGCEATSLAARALPARAASNAG